MLALLRAQTKPSQASWRLFQARRGATPTGERWPLRLSLLQAKVLAPMKALWRLVQALTPLRARWRLVQAMYLLTASLGPLQAT